MLLYLGVRLYGIWAVILVFVNWIIFFDFGIANGVKNKVSEALSKNKVDDANHYISTGYIILFTFCFIIYLLFFLLSYHLNWQSLLNITIISNDELSYAMHIIVFFVLLNFALSIIVSVLNAVQKASFIVLGQFMSQLFSLILILILMEYFERSLIYICFSYGLALVLSNIILSIVFYKNNLHLLPRISNFEKIKIKPIFGLGMKFFFLQLTILIIFTSDTMIITQLLGPEHVTTYSIIFKYFSVVIIIHTVVNTPLWSMYTESHIKNDHVWIKKTLMSMIKLIFVLIILAIFMYLMRDIVFKIWIGDTNLLDTKSNYIYMMVMTLMYVWHSTFSYFTNGINKTKNQLISTGIGAIINIPLSIYFVKYLNMGLDGVILATIISLSIFNITGSIQAFREIKDMEGKKHENIT